MSKPVADVVCENCGNKDKLVSCDGYESKGYNCEDVTCEDCSFWDEEQEVWRCASCDDKHGRYRYCHEEPHEYNENHCDDECPFIPECFVCHDTIFAGDNVCPCVGKDCEVKDLCHSCATFDDVEKVYRCCDCADEHASKPISAENPTT